MSASPSTSNLHERAKRWPLDSPQNSAKRQRRRSVVVRGQLLDEIKKAEEAIVVLEQQNEENRHLSDMRSESESERESEEAGYQEDEDNISALEALLKEMDDGALASLLTENITPTSIEALLPFFKQDKMAILPPAKSAGVEGAGSASQVDTEASKIDEQQGNPTEEDAEHALEARLERGTELLGHLATFTSIDFHTVHTTVPHMGKQDLSRIISMNGKMARGLGEIKIELEVSENVEQRTGPQITRLKVNVEDVLYRALGKEHLRKLIQEKNLPAVMLSLRTLLPMAETRLRLFQTLISAFPSLAQEQLRREPQFQSILQGKHKSTTIKMNVLVDPLPMEKLSLQNKKGARLDVIFSIRFNRWGHAQPNITLSPKLPSVLSLSVVAQDVLERLPSDFTDLCGRAAFPLDVETGLVTTIQAFFGF